MDGTTLGDDEDMFAEIRLAHRLHRTTKIGGLTPSLTDSFALNSVSARRSCAKRRASVALRVSGGSRQVSSTGSRGLAPEADPLAVVLQRAKQGDVATVLIDGEVVLRDGLRPGSIGLQPQKRLPSRLLRRMSMKNS